MTFVRQNPLYSALIAVELVLLAIALVYLFTGVAELSRYYPPIRWIPVYG